jgi:tetratricopeptide (TPR) repeat protein
MPINAYIRRERSTLSGGALFARPRRATPGWVIPLIVFLAASAGIMLWQFNALQLQVLSMAGVAPTPTLTPLEFARAGDLAYWRGDLADSILSYRQAVQADPANVDYRFELVRVLIYHSYEDQHNSMDVSETAPDADGKETLLVYSPDGKQQGALQIAQQATLDNPSNGRAFAILCFAQMEANKAEEALQSCRRSLELRPNEPDTYAYQAYAYYALARYDSAAESANLAVGLAQQLSYKSIDAYVASARVYTAVGKFDQALTAYTTAQKINPKLEFPYFELAAFALARQKAELAISAYNQVLSNNPRSIKAYSRLCSAYFNTGEFTSAINNCDQALTIDSNYLDALSTKGQILYRNRRYEEAVATLDVCVLRETDLYNADPSTFTRDEDCWMYLGLAKLMLGHCDVTDSSDNAYPQGAIAIFTDFLNWASNRTYINTANDGISRCNTLLSAPNVRPTQPPKTPATPSPSTPQTGA